MTGLCEAVDGSLYGAYASGAPFGAGGVFKITAGAFTTLVSFNRQNGGVPKGPVIQGFDGNFYGTTAESGANGGGTVLRMHCRSLTRLTNAFSKKIENFQAAVALNFAYYNFCKVHSAICCTPAQAAGVESSILKVSELIKPCGE